MAKCIIYLLASFCLLGTAKAQLGLSFSRISVEGGSGLRSNIVSALYQDKKGYIWVGNDNGLQRFDGNKFVDILINEPGSDAMPHAPLAQIVTLPDGKMLLGFETYGEIGLFDPADFSYHKCTVQLDSANWPRGEFVMIAGSNGNVLLNVIKAGLLQYEAATNTFLNRNPFHFAKEDTPWSKQGIFYDAVKKQFWIATCTHNLLIYDEGSRQMWTKDFNPRQLHIFNTEAALDCPRIPYIDKQRRIWLFTWGKKGQQPYCYDSTGTYMLQKDTAGLFEGPMSYAEWNYMFETRSGEFWIYGGNTLFNFDKTTGRFHYNINTAANNSRGVTCGMVAQLMEDRDGNLWIGTDNGLFYSNRSYENAVLNYTIENSKTQPSISSILEMPDKSMWLGLWGDEISVIDSNYKETRLSLSHTRTPLPADWDAVHKLAVNQIWTLCHRKASGKILAGCQFGVLVQYDPLTRTAEYYKPPELGGWTIKQVTEDQNGVVWLSTFKGQLFKWKDSVFTKVLDTKNVAEKLIVDRQGWLWAACTNSGVFAIDVVSGKILRHYTHNNVANSSLYQNGGTDIAQLNDSIMAVAGGAINFINRKTGAIRWFGYEQGLPANNARQLQVDTEGFLWIITLNGLCRYNPATNRIITYGRKDGVNVASIVGAAGLRLSNGTIVFAGDGSFLMLHPKELTGVKKAPNISITDFKLFNTFLPVDSLLQMPEIRLNQDQNSFSIFFSALSYSQKDRLTYHYKMEGIDKDWNLADNTFSRNYSLLPPGHYVFKIYGETIDGQRSSDITEMHFYIRPPFWRTGWFICLCLIAVALIIYTVHNARISKLLAMEKLRNRVARDLHDDMGSTLSTINILSAMAKTKMNVDTVKTSEYLTKISDNSQRMMEAMDDIVWSIKPSNDSLLKITARMREFATNVLEAKDIALQFEVAEDVCDIKLNMAARRDFFLVFKEAVNNAAKYSRADRVAISVSCKSRRLLMKVKDNGVGFATGRADGNGLSNMQKRADAMNGSINIISAPGKGTEVVMSIPIS